MALNSLICADVPLTNCSLTHSVAVVVVVVVARDVVVVTEAAAAAGKL